MDPVLYFWYYNQKTITFIAVLAQTRLSWHRHINAFFGLKTVVNQKSVNLGMISARHTTNRQSFKKVTCPFKDQKNKLSKITAESWIKKLLIIHREAFLFEV